VLRTDVYAPSMRPGNALV